MAQILIIEDEVVLARNICDALDYSGHDTEHTPTGEAGLERMRAQPPDLVLLDLRLPKMDGFDVLKAIRGEHLSVPVIIMTAHGTIDIAVDAMKIGAVDFLTKPLDIKALQLVVDRVMEHQRVVANLDYFRNRERQDSGVATIIGDSSAMKMVKERILRLVASPAMKSEFAPSVLLTGETGTGKDLIARAIHYEGPRSNGPFVHVNCTAVPDELFEAELFGHVKGAFTSASENKTGLLEVADGGTIFLDEIGHTKLALQAKLLTAIEQKRIRPVGGTAERRIDVQIISATNRDMRAAIEAGEFREDLFYRLQVVPIELPPLRQRREDIEPLANYFVARFAMRTGISVQGISIEATEMLQHYDWPGNVRELSHVLESAVLMCDDALIKPSHLQIRIRETGEALKLSIEGAKTIDVDFARGGSLLDDVEYTVMQAALEHADHNVSRAARMLGITRETLRYRIDKHRERLGGLGSP